MTDKNVHVVITGNASGGTRAMGEMLQAYRNSRAAADELRLRLAAQRAEMDRVAASSGKQSDEYRKLRAEVRSLTRDLGEADRFSKGFEKSLGAATTGGGSGLTTLAAGLKGVAGPLTAAATAAVSVREAFTTLAQFDRLNASLKTVEGSADGAAAAMQMLKRFSAETPYELDQVTEAYIRLRSLGLDASEKSLRSYGNTAAAMGKPIMQFIEAVADASTGEFERLKEFGIRASKEGDNVAMTFQGVTTTIRANAGDIQQYLLRIGETTFATGMKDQMNTLDGSLSNLKDAFANFVDFLGSLGIRQTLKALFNGFTEIIKETQEGVEILTGRNLDRNLANATARLEALQKKMQEVSGGGGRPGLHPSGYMPNVGGASHGADYLNRLSLEISAAQAEVARLQLAQAAANRPPPATPASGLVQPSSPGPDSRSVQGRYEQYRALFAAASSRYNLPDGLLAAMAWQESKFNPAAVSYAGARGMMQFMPGTARRFGLQNPHDPASSVDAAGRYMRTLLDLYRGQEDQLIKAIASYNAGEGNVMKYGIARVLSPSWGRAMSKGETGKYVRSILGKMDEYGGDGASGGIDLGVYQQQLQEREALWKTSLDRQQAETDAAVARSGARLQTQMAQLDKWLAQGRIEREIALIGKVGEDRSKQLVKNAQSEAEDLRTYAEARARIQQEEIDNEEKLARAKGGRYAQELAHLRETGAEQSQIEAQQLKAQEIEVQLSQIQERRKKVSIEASTAIAEANAREAQSLAELKKAAEEAARERAREMPSAFEVAASRRVSLEEDPNAYLSRRESLLSGTESGRRMAYERANREAQDAFTAGELSADELGQVLENNKKLLIENSEAAREFGFVLSSAAGNAITQWEGFGSFFLGLAKDIEQMLVKIVILGPLENAVSSGLSGFSWGGLMSAVGLHSGGMVGSEATFTRRVSPAVFAGAPRFHTGGIVGGEVPIIAKRGEGVFTREQMAALGRGAGNVTVNVNDYAGVRATVTRGTDGSGGPTIDVLLENAMTDMINSGRLDNALGRVVGQRNPVKR